MRAYQVNVLEAKSLSRAQNSPHVAEVIEALQRGTCVIEAMETNGYTSRADGLTSKTGRIDVTRDRATNSIWWHLSGVVSGRKTLTISYRDARTGR